MDTFILADTAPAPYYYPTGLFELNMVLNNLWPLMFAMIIHFAPVFPVRKWPLSRWPRLTPVLLYGLPSVGTVLALSLNQVWIYNLALGVMILALIVALTATMAYNLRRVRNPVAHAQVGWVVLGISAPIAAVLITFGSQILFPKLDSGYLEWSWSLASILLPLCIGIAITRYRLFDINLIIRRTLAYSLLTGLLAVLYFGSVTLLQILFSTFTGSQSAIALVISTLIIAAIFNPLRRRIQAFIDRRFYRQKYDAEQALASFAATLRQELDLDEISQSLLAVAVESTRPERISLWLGTPRKSSSPLPVLGEGQGVRAKG
jgi:hypothetical protein